MVLSCYSSLDGSLEPQCQLNTCNEYKSSVLFFGVELFFINAKVLLACRLEYTCHHRLEYTVGLGVGVWPPELNKLIFV